MSRVKYSRVQKRIAGIMTTSLHLSCIWFSTGTRILGYESNYFSQNAQNLVYERELNQVSYSRKALTEMYLGTSVMTEKHTARKI